MAGFLEIAADVQAIASAADLRWLRNVREARKCPVDDLVVQVGVDDAAVICDIYLDETVFGFAHLRCAKSQVRWLGMEMPQPTEEDVATKILVQPTIQGDRPVLLVEYEYKKGIITGGGELLDSWTMGLLEMGWTWMATVGKIPMILPGWKVNLDPFSGRGSIIDADGQSFLDDLGSDPPVEWIRLLADIGELTILSGKIDIDLIELAKNPFAKINKFARDGELIGATISVERVSIPTDSIRSAGRQVAGYMAKACREVPGNKDTLTKARVPLGVNTTLTPVRSDSGVPFLMIDLCSDDMTWVTQTLAAIHELGFPKGASDDLSAQAMRNAPRGWFCAVWSSQIKIFAPVREGKEGKLWFARLEFADLQWLRDVQRSAAVGLVIGNKLPQEFDILDLINDLRRGIALGGGVGAFCMQDL